MKKIIIFSLLLLTSFTIKAQVYLGAKVGIAPSLLSHQSLPNHKSTPMWLNPLAGVIVEIPIVFGFSIQPEVQFVQRFDDVSNHKILILYLY